MCGECCRMNTADSNLIIMSAPEVREIMAATGLSWDEVAEPYPDLLEEDGVSYTFDWCIRRHPEGSRSCVFQGADNRCTIYEHRPWICRTYPLMLADDIEGGRTVTNLIKSECLCYGNKITDEEAGIQAEDLISRKMNEDTEFMKIKSVYTKISLQKIRESGIKRCVIDSEGVKEIV
ncbi:MAG: YkgJ family cysteine cluster protein [Methanomicrobium sp.]|nr:YkgJ family cysteine cluster protein [Methanomicrobium sp.]MBQ3718323.1 YkgJ family cysteine cluster protein [Methanomicrobium sp.]MBQ4415306.1 YkgJ family cysteine cluster protein [Methanomicrobium sp.]